MNVLLRSIERKKISRRTLFLSSLFLGHCANEISHTNRLSRSTKTPSVTGPFTAVFDRYTRQFRPLTEEKRSVTPPYYLIKARLLHCSCRFSSSLSFLRNLKLLGLSFSIGRSDELINWSTLSQRKD